MSSPQYSLHYCQYASLPVSWETGTPVHWHPLPSADADFGQTQPALQQPHYTHQVSKRLRLVGMPVKSVFYEHTSSRWIERSHVSIAGDSSVGGERIAGICYAARTAFDVLRRLLSE